MTNEHIAKGTHLGFAWYVRHNGNGYRCGYVAIPKGHPWYMVQYEDVQGADVHGGLTYSQLEGEHWVIGFDCAHSFDAPDPSLPGYIHTKYPLGYRKVRSFAYVQGECLRLCEQARNA